MTSKSSNLNSRVSPACLGDFHSFPYYHDNPDAYADFQSNLYKFQVGGQGDEWWTLGYITNFVVAAFSWSSDWTIDSKFRTIRLSRGLHTPDIRTKAITDLLESAKKYNKFKVLRGWRNELYPVFNAQRELILSMERAGSPLFGIVTYGVHMTAYVREESGALKIWVPRRAKNKETYGGMLDNTVAGGISTGEKPFECLVREAQEEASFPEELVRKKARACGTVTYFHIRDQRAGGESGLMQPECQYVYELDVDPSVTPKPGDKEVEDFYLWSVKEVQAAMNRGEFKPNCALVLLDFFIRHGIFTAENEKEFIEIVARIHRRLEFPTASFS